MKIEEIECGCGCRTVLNKYDSRGRQRTYLSGHSSKGKKMVFSNPEERNRKLSESHKGKKLSEETKRKIGESGKGKKHPSASEKLRGNKFAEKDGWYRHRGYIYVRWSTDLTGKATYRPEHVLIMEEIIGRRLKPGEVVHHIDEVVDNNCEDNLYLCSVGEHRRIHAAINKRKKGELLLKPR